MKPTTTVLTESGIYQISYRCYIDVVLYRLGLLDYYERLLFAEQAIELSGDR